MRNNNTGFLAFFGLLIALAVGGFFFVPMLFEKNDVTVSETVPASKPDSGATAAPPAAASAPKPANVEAAKSDQPESWVMPSFDVLRVEPDGSTVIAGKAEPGTRLDIMNGETVIASTTVGPSGDFAAVLDAPLPAGDYQLMLRIVDADGQSRLSEEVATISIPENADGDLLAMVTKPGKASRIIAHPAAPVLPQSAEAPQAVETGVSAEPAGSEGGAKGAASSETTAAADSDSVEVASSKTARSGKTESRAADAAQAEGGEAVTPNGDAAQPLETPELPAVSSVLTTTAPEPPSDARAGDVAAATDAGEAAAKAGSGQAPGRADTGETIGSDARVEAEAAAAPAPGDGSNAAGEATAEVAALAPGTASQSIPAAVPGDATVRVDAIEIEGERIFIAGSATPGASVRVSADGKLIGTDKADKTGRFIVEATAELAVGDHTITAELIDGANGAVVLRAAVPFNRPEGEAHAAVAPAGEPAQADTATPRPDAATVASAQPAAPALIVPDIYSLSKMREDAFEALSALEQMMVTVDQPNAGAVMQARETAVAKLEAAATANLPADSGVEAKAMAQSMRAQANAALAVIDPPKAAAPDSSSGSATTAAERAAKGDAAGMREVAKQAQVALSQPADIVLAPTPDAGEAQPGQPRTIVQAPLASAPGAVIIRRGDTLWQISRRTYGQGVRYTTIYLANRSQIQNPDRIQPGQVFSVPENPLDNAEEVHRQLKAGQGR